jgi:hypothetical protein
VPKKNVLRLGSFVASGLLLVAGVTCTDNSPTGPRSGHGGLTHLGFVPAFSQAATEIFRNLEAFGFEVDNVHLHLTHASGATAKDTTIAVSPGQDSVVIELVVPLDASQEQLDANIELRDGTTVLFSGTQAIAAKTGGIATTPPPIAVEYSGPGAKATVLALSPKDTAIIAGDSITLHPTGKDKDGQNVPDLALAWSVKDPARGIVNDHGVFKANAGRGSTYVIGRLLSGPRDSAQINVTPPATKLVVVSGGDQTATVGKALPQAIVIEAQASDNLPVPFVPLTLNVASGGGSVSPASAYTGANGRANLTLTLGTVAGGNTLEVTKAGIAPVVVSATGTPDKASKLVMTQQPSANASSGTALSTQPKVQARDAFGNAVAAANIGVTAKLTAVNGRTLGGTLTVNTNGAGVAEFADLKISGPPGTASLTFGQDTLASAVSSDIAVAVGPAAVMTVEGAVDVTHVAGSPPDNPPSTLVTDAGGNGIADVSLQIVVKQGDVTVRDTTVKTDATGRVGFLRIPLGTVAGSYVVTVSNAALAGSPKVGNLTITPAAAAKLKVTTPPTTPTQSGTAFAQQPVVKVMDTFGNTVTTSSATIGAGVTASNALTGTTSKAAVSGIATFTDLGITGTAGTAKLGFTSTGLSPDSAVVTVTAAPPANIVIVSGDGVSLPKGGEVVTQLRVTDGGGNNLSGVTVMYAIVAGTGGSLGGSSTTTNGSGVANMDWHVGTAGSPVMRATVTGVMPVDFHAFIPETLVVITQPTSAPESGVPFPTQPKVQLQDLAGHQVKLPAFSIQATGLLDPMQDLVSHLTGTLTRMTDANGEATWTDLAIEGQTAPSHPSQTVKLRFGEPGGGVVTILPTFSSIMTLHIGPPRLFAPANAGGPNYRFAPGTTTTSVAVAVSDGFNPIAGFSMAFAVDVGSCSLDHLAETTDASGVATATITIPATTTGLSSCLIRAQPNIGGEVFIPESNKVRLHTYIAPDAMLIWTGAVSDDWSDAQNWFAHSVPDATTDVFVPAAAGGQSPAPRYPKLPDASPTQETHALMTETLAHIDLNGKELYVRDSLAADGAIVGPGTVGLGIAPTKVRGIVHALLELGEDGCPSFNQYQVSGLLVADSIVANCRLVLSDAFVVAVLHDFRSSSSVNGGGLTVFDGAITIGGNALFDGGALTQSGGAIAVTGNALLNGPTNLDGGALFLSHNFSHQGSCSPSNTISATSSHVTWFSGTTTGTDTLKITWNADGECTSRLGTVQIATTGDAGITFSTTTTMSLSNLHIQSGGKLYVPPSMIINAAEDALFNGVFILEGGILTNDGTVNVYQGSGDNCPVGMGVIPGQFICARHPS